MHGSLLHGFKQFVVNRDGPAGWQAVVDAAGSRGYYFSTEVYPDEEMLALVRAAAGHEERSVREVLEDYGAALVPTLMTLYRSFVDPSWRTLELLENVERVIHRTVRLSDPLASPPLLRPRRVSEHAVEIEYASPRRLCAVALGICRGVAVHYHEHVVIEQPECMERGDPACRLVVRRD